MTTLKRIGVGLTAFATAFTALFTPIQELFPVAAAAAQEVQENAEAGKKPEPKQPTGAGTKENPFQISSAAELWWFAGYVNGTLPKDKVNETQIGTDATTSDAPTEAPADTSAPETTVETTATTEATTEVTTAATTEETTATTEDTSESTSDTSAAAAAMEVESSATESDDVTTADTTATETPAPADSTTDTAGTTAATTPAPAEEKEEAHPDACAVLTADIDLNGSKENLWYPIGRSGSGLSGKSDYKGVFDGQGYTISNLYIDSSINSTGRPFTYGLFGNNAGTIKNLEVIGTINILAMDVGLVSAANSGTIENCKTSGTITGSYAVGGITGYNSGLVKNCYTEVTSTGSGTNHGAIVGVSGQKPDGKGDDNFGIYNCYYNKDKFPKNGVGQGHTDVYSVDGLTTEQLKTGEVAWKLQNGKTEVKAVNADEDIIWGQELGDSEKDTSPVLLTDEETDKQVCQVTYRLGEEIVGYEYVNTGDCLEKAPVIDYVVDGFSTGDNWYKDENKTTGQEWKFESDDVDSDITLYSEKAPKNYTITLDMDGGTLTDENGWTKDKDNKNYTKTYTVQSDNITLPKEATKEGYRFLGWTSEQSDEYKGEAQKDVTVKTGSTGDRTFKAEFVDATAPDIEIKLDSHTWKNLYEDPQFDLFFTTNQKVTITATDTHSPEKLKIQYLISEKKIEESALANQRGWTDYTPGTTQIELSPTNRKNVIIYVKVTDGTNTAYASSTGLVFDIVEPVISGISDDSVYCTEATFWVKEDNVQTITVNDTVVYDCKQLTNEPEPEDDLEVLAAMASVVIPDHLDVSVLRDKYTITNDTKVKETYTITVTDRAGNKATDTVTINGQHTRYHDISEEIKAPTCTEKGLKLIHTVCRTCGIRYGTVQAEVAARGHSWNAWENVETPNCNDKGLRKHKCRVCGLYQEENLDPNGHDWQDEFTIDKQATCDSEGSRSIHCKNCDATKDNETIAQLEHVPGEPNNIDSKPATCTSDGYITTTVNCTLCGKQLDLKNEKVPSLGHQYGDWEELPSGTFQHKCTVCGHLEAKDDTDADHKWATDYKIDKEATCTTDGSMSICCTICGTVKESVTIPAKGHTPQTAIKENEVLATCTDGGSYEDVTYCLDCHIEIIRVPHTTVPNGHTWGDWVDLEMPDCDDEGTQQHTCDVCGATETRGLNASGHSWEDKPTVDVPATCTTEGSQSIHCTKCDATQESEVIPALGHTWGEWETLNAPDCDDTGTQQRKCTVCGVTETNGLEAAGHKWEDFYTIDVEPTCTTDGSKSYHCEICDIRGAAEVIPAHGHSWGEWKTLDAPDCDDNGTQQRSCDICGVTENKGLDPTGHKWQTDFTTDTEPTCSEEGSKSIHCENCSATKDSTTIPATGNHTYGDWKVLIEANCTETGLKEHQCTVCGITETAPIPVNDDHLYGEWVTENDADCGNEGVIKRECERCGEEEIAYIPATGKHTPGEPVHEKEKPADCGHSGSYESVVYCEVCDTELSRDTVTIPATGEHNYKVEVVAPTYGAPGYTLHTCTVCGDSYTDTETAKLTLDAVKGFALKGRSGDAIRVGWTKNAKADGYELQCLVDGKWKSIYKAEKNTVTEYRYSGLSGSTKYELRIRAYKTEDGKTYYSEYTTAHFTTNPTAVKNFKLTARTSKTLTLSWTKDASADGYIIEKKVGSTWERVTKLVGNTKLGYIVSGLSAGTAYTIRIKPYHMDGKTALYGNTVSISARTDPSDVSGLKLKGRAGNALRLAWAKNTSADGYIIEKKVGNTWKRVTKITKNTTLEYRITGLTAGTEYMFRVRCYKMSGKTALYSGYVYGTYATNPSEVSGLKLKAANSSAVRLAWSKNTSADGYIIEMKSGSTWTRVAKITKNSTVEYRKSGLKSKTSYTFRIKTYKMSGKTALYSATKTITVKTK